MGQWDSEIVGGALIFIEMQYYKRGGLIILASPHLSQYSPILLKLQKFSHPSHFYLKPETPYAKIGKNKVL